MTFVPKQHCTNAWLCSYLRCGRVRWHWMMGRLHYVPFKAWPGIRACHSGELWDWSGITAMLSSVYTWKRQFLRRTQRRIQNILHMCTKFTNSLSGTWTKGRRPMLNIKWCTVELALTDWWWPVRLSCTLFMQHQTIWLVRLTQRATEWRGATSDLKHTVRREWSAKAINGVV